ncbi:hypothetical protein QQX10_13590 [Demequina sp. SYSU T00039]|uniref:F5/8 type C domain-containing protein n=1 Tax=Demequina lignilytica TaxID=3051663 RepID=A0AAW7MAJ8_9MICO|nr:MULTISPECIES: hypothetical protein [unclassified Demequina]MDN4479301.1 hypothetical protein [Demequina sp. SYSU T00039-1]MDN4489201.1 hypothetical protein [Demequina sp. SYSU T00039]
MRGPVTDALAFAAAKGTLAAGAQMPGVSIRARRRVRRLRRGYAWAYAAGGVALLCAVVLLQPSADPVDAPVADRVIAPPPPISASSDLGDVGARTIASSGAERQAALSCAATASPGTVQVCDAVWIGDAPLIDVSDTSLAVGPGGEAQVTWRVSNVAAGALKLDVSRVTVAVVDGDSVPSPTPPSEPGATAPDVVASAGSSWWASPTTRYAFGGDAARVETLSRGVSLSGVATLPAGSVAPAGRPRVLIQIALAGESDGGGRTVLEGTTAPLSSIATTAALLDSGEPRTASDPARGRLSVLVCDATGSADDRVPDRWGNDYLWTPTCDPIWITGDVLADVVVRSDLDRSPYTRVVRWSAVNASGATLTVDLGATTAVLELAPPVEPHESRLWASTGDGIARIDTLWRSTARRTAAIRGPGSQLVQIAPGETVAGSAAFHFPASTQAEDWGERLERTTPVVHLVLAAAGVGDDALVLELAPG